MTGASRGIGAATAERLRRDGWQVETAERATGVDLSDPGAARRAVDGLERIDALVANAAAHVRKPALQTSLDEWQYLVDLPPCSCSRKRPPGRWPTRAGARSSYSPR